MSHVIDSTLLHLPRIYHSLLDEIGGYMSGHPPLLLTSNDLSRIGHAFLSEPGLYPTIIVPQSPQDDWSKVGFGPIIKVMNLRKHAAHGRNLPIDALTKAADAIEALERLPYLFEK